MRSTDRFKRYSRPALVLPALLALLLPACVENPKNGDVLGGTIQGKTLSFTGKHSYPDAQVLIQVMKEPDDPDQEDPAVGAHWVTIATATSSSSPLYYNDPSPYYSWSKSATPVPNAGAQVRWPQGGIMRFRAITPNGSVLATFDQDRLDCYASRPANESWIEIGDACKSTMSSQAVVSPWPTPADAATPPNYLDIIPGVGVGSEDETVEYYQNIDAPPTLQAFRTQYGFSQPGNNEESATYFNAGDLGTGREMHCNYQVALGGSPTVACYVSNYGDGVANFGGNPQAALANTIAGTESGVHDGAFATVAMVYQPPITNDNSVRFIVYGPNGDLVNKAQLDSTGHNQGIPHNCIHCHGGGSYDPASHSVRGASGVENGGRFLPFDLDAFEFSNQAGYTRADQQEDFRKLNRMITMAGPTAATTELIAGWYGPGGVDVAGTTADTSFVPPAFNGTSADAKVYREVVAPYCRTCHISQSDELSFADSVGFNDENAFIYLRTCANIDTPDGNHVMPNAEVTLKRFWASPARAYLVGYLGLTGSCSPYAP